MPRKLSDKNVSSDTSISSTLLYYLQTHAMGTQFLFDLN